ncbi:hypothetical protein DFS34DRAFT_593775 [Phlyctochytrium arcticum]|nr:hypothetical protein DFS34DRAFT_593775 [Phlyctochytrium arcticum]
MPPMPLNSAELYPNLARDSALRPFASNHVASNPRTNHVQSSPVPTPMSSSSPPPKLARSLVALVWRHLQDLNTPKSTQTLADTNSVIEQYKNQDVPPFMFPESIQSHTTARRTYTNDAGLDYFGSSFTKAVPPSTANHEGPTEYYLRNAEGASYLDKNPH